MKKILFTCQYCGKTKYVTFHVAKTKKYCSLKCKYSAGLSEKTIKKIKKNTKLALNLPKIKKKHKKNLPNRFGKNHPLYGKRGKNNPNYGSKRTQKQKDKMRKNRVDVSGRNNPRYINNKTQDKNKRWYIWSDNEGKRVPNSRYIAEQCLNRELSKEEIVHHINEDKSDDRPENLYLFPNQSNHMKYHRLKNQYIIKSNLIK